MALSFEFKRGDSFNLSGTVTDADDLPVDLTGYTITSQLRSQTGALIQTFTVTVTDAANGLYTISAPATGTAPNTGTDIWPIGTAKFDVQFAVGAEVTSSETVTLKVVEDYTR
jgi:hypothetical protein